MLGFFRKTCKKHDIPKRGQSFFLFSAKQASIKTLACDSAFYLITTLLFCPLFLNIFLYAFTLDFGTLITALEEIFFRQ